jgi:hypothetical protein
MVLWSDDYTVNDPNGGGSGTGSIVTVMALTADGGGPYATFAFDTSKPPNARNHPTGAGVLGDPGHSLIAMRLPHFDPKPAEVLQIIAPPTATKAEILRGTTVVGTATLDRGVARVPLSSPTEVTVRAYDAGGSWWRSGHSPTRSTTGETACTSQRSATGEPVRSGLAQVDEPAYSDCRAAEQRGLCCLVAAEVRRGDGSVGCSRLVSEVECAEGDDAGFVVGALHGACLPEWGQRGVFGGVQSRL